MAELYSAVMRGQRCSAYSRVTAFYEEWDRIFGAVYGEKLGKAEKAADETARLYHLPSGVRLKPLLNEQSRWSVLITVYRPDPDLWINWRERRPKQ